MKDIFSDKRGKGKKVFSIVLIVIAALIISALVTLYVVGSSGRIQDNIPSAGIDVINVPFSGKGEEKIPVYWLVHGTEESDIISAAYFSPLPSQEFNPEISPSISGYTGYVSYEELELENGYKVLKAEVPNAYEVIYVRIYADINGKNYWSKEFAVRSK